MQCNMCNQMLLSLFSSVLFLESKVSQGDSKAIYRLLHALCLHHIKHHPQGADVLLGASQRAYNNRTATGAQKPSESEGRTPARVGLPLKAPSCSINSSPIPTSRTPPLA